MKIRWPRLTFPPINLWNAPRQWAWEDRMTMDNDQPSWQELKDERDALAREVDALDKAIRRQANAAKRGMNAAKEYGAHMEAEAKRLHAECNPKALDSERAANARLTEELERVEAERDAQAARIAELEGYNIGLANEAHELRQQRTAMAAYVERLREAITPFAAGGAADCISRGDYSVMRERIKDWMGVKDFEMAAEALRETPATSLARQKLRWQAEALEQESENFARDAGDADSCTEKLIYKRVARCLRESSAKLRRQAEEPAE